MSNFVSLLAPPATNGAAPEAPRFPGPAQRTETAPAFTTALDRAVQHSPKREVSADKPGRSRANQEVARPETAVHQDRREPLRGKNKNNPRDEEQSLAGACAVNGQAANPETPMQPVAEADGVAAQEPVTNASGESTLETSTATTDEPQPVVAGGQDPDGEATAASETLLQAMTSPPDELETSLQPLPTPVEISPTGEAVDLLAQANLESATGLPLASAPKVSSAIAAVLGTDGISTTPDAAVAPNTLPPAAAAEVAKQIAPGSDEPQRPARAARRSLTEALEDARGIAGAKSTETMKTAIKKEEIAGPGQQLLPGSAAIPVAAVTNLPGEARLGAPVGVSPADALNAMAKLSPAPTRSDVSGAGEMLDLRPATPLARISEVISREVRMFKRAGDDLVEVVLTPDAKTQISLRLQWREGQVEVQARCDLGDHHSLNQQWPQLQAAMAQHGVRLSHLNERIPTGFTEFFSNPGFSQQQGGERRSPANANGAEHGSSSVVPSGKSAAAGNTGGRSNRLLESWA